MSNTLICYTQIGYSHAFKYQTGVRVTDSDEHSSLFQFRIIYFSHFYTCLLFEDSVRSLPILLSPVSCVTCIGYSLANKYQTRMEASDSDRCSTHLGYNHAFKYQTGVRVTDSDTYPSLLQYKIHYQSKKFYCSTSSYYFKL